MNLRSRTHKRDESLPELLEDTERLVRLAYPGATSQMLELLAKDQFIDSLTDPDMKLKVRQSRPESIQETISAALEL